MQVWFHGQAYDSTFWDNGLVSDVRHWFGHCHVRQPYNVLWDKTSWRKISFFDSKWNPFFLVQLVQINQRPFNFQSKTLCIHLNSEYSSAFSIFDRVDWYFIHWFSIEFNSKYSMIHRVFNLKVQLSNSSLFYALSQGMQILGMYVIGIHFIF